MQPINAKKETLYTGTSNLEKTSLLPNAEPPRHIVGTVPRARLAGARVEKTLHSGILRQLPPLVPLFLLLHDLPRQRRGCRILEPAVRGLLAIRLGLRLLVFVRRGLGLGGCAVGFLVGGLLALLAAGRFLECVCEDLLT